MPNSGFAIKHIYPSEQGLDIVHYSIEEAAAAYADARSKGMNVELDCLIMTFLGAGRTQALIALHSLRFSSSARRSCSRMAIHSLTHRLT